MKQELEDAFDFPQASPFRGSIVLDHRYSILRNRSVELVSFPDLPPPFRQFYLDRGAVWERD